MALSHNARKIFSHLDLDKLEVTQYRTVSSVSDVLHFHFHLCTCQNAICTVLYITEWFVELCCLFSALSYIKVSFLPSPPLCSCICFCFSFYLYFFFFFFFSSRIYVKLKVLSSVVFFYQLDLPTFLFFTQTWKQKEEIICWWWWRRWGRGWKTSKTRPAEENQWKAYCLCWKCTLDNK